MFGRVTHDWLLRGRQHPRGDLSGVVPATHTASAWDAHSMRSTRRGSRRALDEILGDDPPKVARREAYMTPARATFGGHRTFSLTRPARTSSSSCCAMPAKCASSSADGWTLASADLCSPCSTDDGSTEAPATCRCRGTSAQRTMARRWRSSGKPRTHCMNARTVGKTRAHGAA